MVPAAHTPLQPEVAYPTYRFTAGRWVERDLFYGRIPLLQDVLNELAASPEPQQRRFVGRRRQGKTSMLQAVGFLASCAHQRHLIPNRPGLRPPAETWTLADFAFELEREGTLDVVFETQRKPMLPIYVDVRAAWRTREFALRVAQRIDSALQRSGHLRRVQDEPRIRDGLCSVLDEVGATHRVVLLLDELGALVPGRFLAEDPTEFDQETAALIRLIDEIQVRPDRPPHLYVAAGRDLDLLAAGPLKQLVDSMPVFPIGNLPALAIDAMLARGGLNAEQCADVQARCGGNPFYVQVLGHAYQNSLADAVTQIRAGIENDLEHVSGEERRWLDALSAGPVGWSPQTAPVLERCGYVVNEPGRGWRLRERMMEEYLAITPGRVEPTAPPRPAQPNERMRLALRRYDTPTRQRYGQLELRGSPPVNLGAQNYLLLFLLCEARRKPELALQGEDAKYPMYLALALCGADHGYLNPRGLLSNLRKALRDTDDEEEDESTSWLPKGRGGYRLSDDLDVLAADHPFGHRRPLRRLDLVRAHELWANARRGFVSFLREAAAGGARGLGLRLTLRPTGDDLFPNHPYVVHLDVVQVATEASRVRLGPIPFTEAEATAFRYWREVHDNGEGIITVGSRERRSPDEGGVPPTELCRPFDVLGLRDGGSFARDGRKWSSEWMPPPDAPADFPTSPRWLDLSFVVEETGALYSVERLLRDLED